MKHERTVVVLIALWAVTFSQIVRAATLNEFMGTYDWMSLGWAALIALTGGALRTIVALASQDIVWHVLRQAGRDAVVSLIAGMAAYVALEAYRTIGAVPSEVRFALILAAGVARSKTFAVLAKQARERLGLARTPAPEAEP
jgi:hypothetical protein